MSKPENQSEKRPECEGCKFWRVSDGVPLSYDTPSCGYTERTLPNGDTVRELGTPKIEIRDYGTGASVHREWCSHPFDCKLALSGQRYVKCSECPCEYDMMCQLENADYPADPSYGLKGLISLAKHCRMVRIETEDGQVISPVVGIFE